MTSSKHHLHLLVIMIMSSTELTRCIFQFSYPISICHHSNTLRFANCKKCADMRVIVEDIVTLDSGPVVGVDWAGQLTPGLWSRPGQLSCSALQDWLGWSGLAWGLPWLCPLLLRVRLLSDQRDLGAGHHLQGLQWREQWAGSATEVSNNDWCCLTLFSSL